MDDEDHLALFPNYSICSCSIRERHHINGKHLLGSLSTPSSKPTLHVAIFSRKNRFSHLSLSLITFRSLTKKLLNFHVFYPRVASYQREQSTFRIYPPLLIWGNKGSHVVTEKFSIYKLFTLSMYNHSIFYSSIQEWHHINESSQLSGFITTIDTLRHTGKSSCTHLIMTVFITHVSR